MIHRCRLTVVAVAAAATLSCSTKEPGSSGAEQGATSTSPAGYSEAREPCDDSNALRNAYFGDLHFHTQLSMDSYIFDVRTSPADSYGFARGETLPIPVTSAEDTKPIRIERPLDFAAVTDHASYLGEVKACITLGSPSYDTDACTIYRGNVESDSVFERIGTRLAALTSIDVRGGTSGAVRAPEVCGEDGEICRSQFRDAWSEIQDATEAAYDRSSACRFTAFKAYEYTATPDLSKVHRNVIFRNSIVPALPITWVDRPEVLDLWSDLREQCLDAGTGCDVLAIPHNPNLSNGRIFSMGYENEPIEVQREQARLRHRLEPLVEMMQIKGDSECRNGLAGVLGGNDELCDFERYRTTDREYEDCGSGTGKGALIGRGCISRRDYARYALVEGLREQERIGVNPYKVGFIASTDAHNSNPGDVQERSYEGWSGTTDSTPLRRLSGEIGVLSNLAANPGGLVGVWAEENSRDRLFDAMQRRETFGTSGPRIQPRFFGGWDYSAELCDATDFVERGYAQGVPMGGDLPPRPRSADAPAFMVSALRDPGTEAFPGNKLQRIQIVKGWSDTDGNVHQKVYDVAGSADNGARVDPATCTPTGPGHDSLCAVWRDPDFEADRSAVYYVRVVENPSCRWNAWQCLSIASDRRPEGCSNPKLPKTIQERAWSSPIWYTPS
jgi:hypothetical protein